MVSQCRKKEIFKQLPHQQVFDVRFDFSLLRSIGREGQFCEILDGLSETSPQPAGADAAPAGTQPSGSIWSMVSLNTQEPALTDSCDIQ